MKNISFQIEFRRSEFWAAIREAGLWLGVFAFVIPDPSWRRSVTWVSLGMLGVSLVVPLIFWLARKVPITRWEEDRFLRILEQDQRSARHTDPDLH